MTRSRRASSRLSLPATGCFSQKAPRGLGRGVTCPGGRVCCAGLRFIAPSILRPSLACILCRSLKEDGWDLAQHSPARESQTSGETWPPLSPYPFWVRSPLGGAGVLILAPPGLLAARSPVWWLLGEAPLLCLLPGPHGGLVVHTCASTRTLARTHMHTLVWRALKWRTDHGWAPAGRYRTSLACHVG